MAERVYKFNIYGVSITARDIDHAIDLLMCHFPWKYDLLEEDGNNPPDYPEYPEEAD